MRTNWLSDEEHVSRVGLSIWLIESSRRVSRSGEGVGD